MPSLRFDLPPPCQAQGSVLVKWLARSVARFGGPSRCVCAALAQLVRAPGCGPGGPWFETRRRYHKPFNGLTAPFASSETAKFVLGDTYGRAPRAPHPCRRTSSRFRQTTFRDRCHSRPRIIAGELPRRFRQASGKRQAQARANCRDFVIGHEIDDCDFMKRVQDKRVNPPTFRAGIWALGIRFDPQHRLFGCFALRDWFVVLTKQSRAVLDQGDNRWHEQIIECERIWSELFPQHVPVVSEDIYDYISDKVEKCDDRW